MNSSRRTHRLALSLLLACGAFPLIGCQQQPPHLPTAFALSKDQLSSQRWGIETVNDQAVPANAQAWLEFSPNGMLSGKNGCNQLGGTYQLSGAKLQLSQLSSTMMACQNDGDSDWENRINQVLGEVRSVTRPAPEVLSLHNVEGKTIMQLRAITSTS